jgi:hypothetical protein
MCEDWIVRHQVGAILLLDLHADCLIDFYGDRSCGEVVVQLPDHSLRETRLFKIIGIEGSAQGSMAGVSLKDAVGPLQLRRKVFEKWIPIIDYEDI